ncbi:MAG: hypothetical protein ACR2G6_07400 [Gemmatimonadaceae bacterium]
MKPAFQLVALIFALITVTAAAHAQSPRDQLVQMVAQLHVTPADSGLRGRIIALALEVKPAPGIPDEAIEFEGRAQFAFRSAKSEADFLLAAREYEKALAAAPWVPGYYSDICTIYEKANRFEDAKRNCQFYLIGLTDPAQATDAKRRIAGLGFAIEQANSPSVREATLMQRVEGAIFVDEQRFNSKSWDNIFQITNGTLYTSIRIYSLGTGTYRMLSYHGHDQPGLYTLAMIPYRDGTFSETSYGITCVYKIRPDAQALLKRCSNYYATAVDDVIARR